MNEYRFEAAKERGTWNRVQESSTQGSSSCFVPSEIINNFNGQIYVTIKMAYCTHRGWSIFWCPEFYLGLGIKT